jgi:hypothetical protein
MRERCSASTGFSTTEHGVLFAFLSTNACKTCRAAGRYPFPAVPHHQQGVLGVAVTNKDVDACMWEKIESHGWMDGWLRMDGYG